MSAERHVYRNRVIDYFVASSLEEAIGLAREYYVDCGHDEDEMDLNFEKIQDEKKIGMICDEDDEVSDCGPTVFKTAAEWAEKSKRGMLGSTEY